jgi:hypothetical protein
VTPEKETPTGKELVEGEPDRWPVKEAYRLTGSPPAISEVYFVGDGEGMPDEPQWYETQTYYPASHPALLSKEEAQMLITSTVPISERELKEWRQLRDRLSDWAEEREQ